MDVILWSLSFAWKVLAICMGFMLFKYVLKNGSGTFKEILDTISVALRTFGHWIRKSCLNYLRKESVGAEAKTEEVSEEHKREFDDLMEIYNRAKEDGFQHPPEFYRNVT